jgi:uncharacterized protein YjiS (DUF1127 family)
MTTQQMTFGFHPTTASAAQPGALARVKRSYPSIAPGTADASNDRAFLQERSSISELEAWVRRAAVASGFGDDAAGTATGSADAFSLARQARAGRHAGLSAVLAALFRSLAASGRRAIASWRRARETRATYHELSRLDARTLRDLGIERSGMGSVAAEIAGESDRTRIQALRTLRMLSHF